MDWAALATPVAVFLAFGLTAWFIHRRFDRYEARLDRFEAAHQACQVAIAKDYATRDDLGKIWARVDSHTKDIATIKGKLSVGEA